MGTEYGLGRLDAAAITWNVRGARVASSGHQRAIHVVAAASTRSITTQFAHDGELPPQRVGSDHASPDSFHDRAETGRVPWFRGMLDELVADGVAEAAGQVGSPGVPAGEEESTRRRGRDVRSML